ncbi:molybdenum cofactor guanylyltransferase [Alteromonas sp. C1M14]|uniref:molybdenum cofactor guanylyltransferase n=1 Tax=Alteromonas sp. C1M14 TaxID=2841567 RepID=UPI001C0829D6|nr:molybdenum cofactor guanylyltransferase [Alteromonas sp. C1M14]MBU2977596.1 molybdenum cofactor guanylyltransferase [Alteromonas sp. C1M14]
MHTVGFVLCGGASSRMGEDKSSLIFDGETLLSRARRTLARECDTVYSVGKAGADIIDEKPLAGPAWGILSAIEKLHSNQPTRIVIMPVDMPLCASMAIKTLLCASEGRQRSVYAEKYLLPLVLISEVGALAKIKRVCAKEQSLSVRFLLSLFAALPVSMDRFPSTTFMNVNNKEDWQRLHQVSQNQ